MLSVGLSRIDCFYLTRFVNQSFQSISWCVSCNREQTDSTVTGFFFLFFGRETHCLIYNIISHTLRQLQVRFFISFPGSYWPTTALSLTGLVTHKQLLSRAGLLLHARELIIFINFKSIRFWTAIDWPSFFWPLNSYLGVESFICITCCHDLCKFLAFFFGMNNIYLYSLTSGLLLSMNLHPWLSLLGQLPGHWEYNVTRFFCVLLSIGSDEIVCCCCCWWHQLRNIVVAGCTPFFSILK